MPFALTPRMGHATIDRLRCLDPRCHRPFAIVYESSPGDSPVSLALACPHCGRRHALVVPTGALHESETAYVLPLQSESAELTA